MWRTIALCHYALYWKSIILHCPSSAPTGSPSIYKSSIMLSTIHRPCYYAFCSLTLVTFAFFYYNVITSLLKSLVYPISICWDTTTYRHFLLIINYKTQWNSGYFFHHFLLQLIISILIICLSSTVLCMHQKLVWLMLACFIVNFPTLRILDGWLYCGCRLNTEQCNRFDRAVRLVCRPLLLVFLTEPERKIKASKHYGNFSS